MICHQKPPFKRPLPTATDCPLQPSKGDMPAGRHQSVEDTGNICNGTGCSRGAVRPSNGSNFCATRGGLLGRGGWSIVACHKLIHRRGGTLTSPNTTLRHIRHPQLPGTQSAPSGRSVRSTCTALHPNPLSFASASHASLSLTSASCLPLIPFASYAPLMSTSASRAHPARSPNPPPPPPALQAPGLIPVAGRLSNVIHGTCDNSAAKGPGREVSEGEGGRGGV